MNSLSPWRKKLTDQMRNRNYSFVRRDKIPKNATLLSSVWQMRRKRDIETRKVKKYKARLNIDGSRMKPGIDYDLTHAPVASWTSVRLLLALTAVHNWHTTQIDYVLAYPQAPVDRELHMKIPKGFELDGVDNPKDYVLKLHKNVYGQKQGGRVWNKYLVDKLVNKVGFTQSLIDECVFYKGNVIYVLCTDDSTLAGPCKDEVDRVIQEIRDADLALTEQGDLQDFLGVRIHRESGGAISFTQPHLIDKILKDLRLDKPEVKTKTTPAASSKLLSRHTDSKSFDNSFHYRSVIGELNYLEKATRSDISYATHQCARFVEDPKVEHAEAVRWLAKYLKGTRDKGMIFVPNEELGLEVFVDSDFAGNWDKKEAPHDKDTARSRHGYIIRYAGCPLVWKSQLQSEIALSSTEAEVTGLSYSLREVIPIMELLKEMQRHGFPVVDTKGEIHCKCFEDNSGAVEIASNPKYRPRTKHLNVKIHHFRDCVDRKEISIHPIKSEDQPADYLTKPVNESTLVRLRRFIMGW